MKGNVKTMARCKKCDAFILVRSKSGLCKKCLEKMVESSNEHKLPVSPVETVKEADPYEQYGNRRKRFHFDEISPENTDIINRWLKNYRFSYLMIDSENKEVLPAVSTTTKNGIVVKEEKFCCIKDIEFECVKEVGAELYSYQLLTAAFESKGNDEDDKTVERYKELVMRNNPEAFIQGSFRTTFSSERCVLLILYRTK